MKKYRRVMSHGTEKWSKEKLISQIHAFLSDAIDLKQSVKGTFKVKRKSLTDNCIGWNSFYS